MQNLSTFGQNLATEKVLKHFVLITEKWGSNGCSTDGLVDALEQAIQMDITWTSHPNGYQSRQNCLGTWMKCCYGCSTDRCVDAHRHLLFTIDAQQMDMLMHSDFINYYYYSLWMPQQMDLLHTHIVNYC